MFIGKVKGLPTYSDRRSAPLGVLSYTPYLHIYTDNFLFSPLGPPRQLCNLHTIKYIYK